MQPGALRAWIFGGSALLSLAPSAAGAQPAAPPVTAQQCNAAYEKAQVLRRARKLRAAREELVLCSQAKCPGAITADCSPWLREVEGGLPSIVIAARDASGGDVPAVKVSVDGVVLTPRLTGAPLDVDPGEHTFTFEPEHGARFEQKLLINMGEKNRLVRVTIHPEAAIPPDASLPPGPRDTPRDEPRKGSFVPGIVVGSVGLVSLAASVGLYFSAKSGIDGLRTTCAPACNSTSVDDLKAKGLASDVTFGVGVAGLGAGVLLMILLRPTAERPAASTGWAVRPVVAPVPGGGVAGLGGRF